MTDELWRRISDIHARARELPESEREAFVHREAAGDPQVVDEVLSLLAVPLAEGDMEPPVASALESGATLKGRMLGPYQLLDELGRGGAGVVFRARDTSLGRDVAVKVLEQGVATTPGELARFRSEPQRIARLRHRGIVAVFATGHEGATNWFAMELVDGHDLGRELDLQLGRNASALLPPLGSPDHVRCAAELAADTAEALQVAHEAGIVHRDVKPQNLLLDRRDRSVHLVDFGIARDERLGRVTTVGTITGTVHYMSPEQTRAAEARVDARTDVYSLGVVLYEVLTQRRPFVGESPVDVWQSIRSATPRSVRRLNPRVPRDLELVVAKAMAREPDDRYATAGELAADLRRFLRLESVHVRPPTLGRRLQRFVRRRARLLASAVGVILVAVGAWSWAVVHAENEGRRAAVVRAEQILGRGVSASVDELVQLRHVASELERWRDESPVAAVLAGVEALLEQVFVTGQRAADRDIATGRANGDDAAVLRGVARRKDLAIVFPDRPELLQAAAQNPFSALLSVQLAGADAAATAEVLLASIDALTGQPGPMRSVGSTPLSAMAIEPGYYRIRVQVPGAAPMEFTRLLERAAREVQVLARVPAASTGEDMVLVAPATLDFREAEAGLSAIHGRAIDVAAFWLDRHEVSNAAYREFLAAHPGRRPPRHWDRIEPGSPADRLPVAFVSWFDARDYAEWRGKRLPTHAEWMCAARGAEARRFPWPLDDGAWRGNTGWPVVAVPAERAVAIYLERAVAVDSMPEAATQSGLYHLLGNVAEWTESLQPEKHGGAFVVTWNQRVVLGSDWTAAARGTTLATALATEGPEDSYAAGNRGFRCARSAD